MSQVNNNKKFVGKVIGEYNQYLIEKGCIDIPDLINFTSDNLIVTNPFVNYNDDIVDPEVEYGDDYVSSDFVKNEFVERLAKQLELLG